MNAQIEQWRDYLQRHPAIRPDDVDELEAHLRDQIDDLRAAGLTEDEAFLIAVGRIGQVDDVSQEFAREHSERLWKQLVIGPTATTPRTLPVAIGLAVAAAVAVKIPSLFGATAQFYVLNAALLVLPQPTTLPVRTAMMVGAVVLNAVSTVMYIGAGMGPGVVGHVIPQGLLSRNSPGVGLVLVLPVGAGVV